jgi:hypothetical protein
VPKFLYASRWRRRSEIGSRRAVEPICLMRSTTPENVTVAGVASSVSVDDAGEAQSTSNFQSSSWSWG